jgi:hypothetical protein
MVVFVQISSFISYAKSIVLDDSLSEKGIAKYKVAVTIEEHRNASLHV